MSSLRHDLQLPNELLHKVILWVLSDNVHHISTSSADSSWQQNIISVLHQVSPAFSAISSELVAKAFDISNDVRNDHAALSRTVREKLIYLNLLGARCRDPSEWGAVSFQTIDFSAPAFVFAYALYLNCVSLRRHSTRSTRDVFESTHNVILSALDQAQKLCDRVKPAEITCVLRRCMHHERQLAVLGLNIVLSFNDIKCYGDALALFQIRVQQDGTGPVTGARHLIHNALSNLEGAYESYQDILNTSPSQPEPHPFELPGVLLGLQRLSTLTIDEDKHNLRERIKKVVQTWC